MTKQHQPSPTASAASPCPTPILILRTPRLLKFTKHHRTTDHPDVAVNMSCRLNMSCHKNRMTTRVITLWRVSVASFLVEKKMFTLKAIKYHFKGSCVKQNLTFLVMLYKIHETTTRFTSSICLRIVSSKLNTDKREQAYLSYSNLLIAVYSRPQRIRQLVQLRNRCLLPN